MQANMQVHTFPSYNSDMIRVIEAAIVAEQQFAALHDGERWTVSIAVPPAQPAEAEKVLA